MEPICCTSLTLYWLTTICFRLTVLEISSNMDIAQDVVEVSNIVFIRYLLGKLS